MASGNFFAASCDVLPFICLLHHETRDRKERDTSSSWLLLETSGVSSHGWKRYLLLTFYTYQQKKSREEKTPGYKAGPWLSLSYLSAVELTSPSFSDDLVILWQARRRTVSAQRLCFVFRCHPPSLLHPAPKERQATRKLWNRHDRGEPNDRDSGPTKRLLSILRPTTQKAPVFD